MGQRLMQRPVEVSGDDDVDLQVEGVWWRRMTFLRRVEGGGMTGWRVDAVAAV